MHLMVTHHMYMSGQQAVVTQTSLGPMSKPTKLQRNPAEIIGTASIVTLNLISTCTFIIDITLKLYFPSCY